MTLKGVIGADKICAICCFCVHLRPIFIADCAPSTHLYMDTEMKLNRKQRLEYHQAVRRLPALKLKMATESDFSAIYNFFFEHFGENPEFLKFGDHIEHPILEQTLTHIARAIFKTDLPLTTHGRFIHLPDQHFVHGSCLFTGIMAAFFYFEDIDAGMAAFLSMSFTGNTEMARFSIKQLGKSSPVSAN